MYPFAVDGVKVHIGDELSYQIMRRGIEPVDLTVIRNGEKITLEDIKYSVEELEGANFAMMDLVVLKRMRNVSFHRKNGARSACWHRYI